MGISIQSITAVLPKNRKENRSSIRLSARAGASCLQEANLDFNKLNLLTNTGIYRDKHLGEPAIAALIHGQMRRLSAPGEKNSEQSNFFSFDLINGGTGPIEAMQVLNSFIGAGKLQTGMLVSGDALPTRWEVFKFPFSSAAMAILFASSTEEEGFVDFYSHQYPEYHDLYTGQLSWKQFNLRKGYRNIIEIEQSPQYLEACVEAAEDSLVKFFEQKSLHLKTTDLIIPSVQPVNFAMEWKRQSGLRGNMVLPEKEWNNVHTAGIGFGLLKAMKNGQFATAEHVIFLTVGAGIKVSIGWYKKRPGS